jgi:AcrR family transcriptional regulator
VERVYEVALGLLAERGLEAVSIPEVAARAGLNKTSVYRRWPTHEALLEDALQASLGAPAEPPDTGALRTDLLALARGALAFAQSPLGKGVVRVLLAQGDSPLLRAVVGSLLSPAATAGPRQVLARAVQRGELDPGVDVSLLLSVVAGTLLQRIHVERRRVDGRFLEALVELVASGAAPRRHPSRPAPKRARRAPSPGDPVE